MLSNKAVMTNIYQGFLLAAIKFVANVRALSLGNRCRKYTNFFFRELCIPISANVEDVHETNLLRRTL